MKLLNTILFLLLIKTASAQVHLDSSFGNNGIVRTLQPVANESGEITNLAIQKDGKIIAAGYSLNLGIYHIQLTRYNPNGEIDLSFGNNGFVNTVIDNRDRPRAIAIQSDGKILVAGSYYTTFQNSQSKTHSLIIRYNQDGTLDNSFGANGINKFVLIDENIDDGFYGLTLTANNKIIVAGHAGDQSLIMQLSEDGTIDTTFGTNGKVLTSVGLISYSMDIKIDPNGAIYTAGRSIYDLSGNSSFAVVKYRFNGNIDSTFNSVGYVTTTFGSIPAYTSAEHLAILDNQKILVSGFNDNDFAAVRYNSNGSIDTTFGTQGMILTNSSPVPKDMAIQEDGKMLITGNELFGIPEDYVLTRFNSDGSIDTNFGQNGYVITVISGSEIVQCVAIQADHKIILGGSSRKDNNDKSAFTLVRLTSDITSIKEVESIVKPVLYPNPTSDFINIPVIKGRSNYSIIDVLGRTVQDGEFSSKIDVSNLSQGTYLLHYKDNEGVKIIKFIRE